MVLCENPRALGRRAGVHCKLGKGGDGDGNQRERLRQVARVREYLYLLSRPPAADP